LPKATRFINARRRLFRWKTLQCRIFFFSLPEIRAWRRVYNVMKLHSTPTQHYQTVTAYDDAGVEINAVRFAHSLIVLPEIAPAVWPVTAFDNLTPEHFAQIEAISPDVVILGTGVRQRFIHPRLVAALTARRIGVECMDNQAACRTYNILMTEGRKVALALIFEQPA
jgi:uncharacterized protein